MSTLAYGLIWNGAAFLVLFAITIGICWLGLWWLGPDEEKES